MNDEHCLQSALGVVFTHNFTGTLDGLALLDETIRTEKHDTDLAGLEVHAHALDAGSEPATVLDIRCIHIPVATWVLLTQQAPRPGHWPCRAHGRYHHY
jgi:hypothetical protein